MQLYLFHFMMKIMPAKISFHNELQIESRTLNGNVKVVFKEIIYDKEWMLHKYNVCNYSYSAKAENH